MSPDPPELIADSQPIVGEAYRAAAAAHAGQRRRHSASPYIEHPLRVAALLREAAFDDEVIAAALLHDVIEHAGMEIDSVAKAFGKRVAELVAVLTDEEGIEPYERRKDAHRSQVEAAGPDAVAIYAADKLANARSLRAAYSDAGEAVAVELPAPLEVRLRLWERDLAMLRRVAPELPFVEPFATELGQLRADRVFASSGAVNNP
jgi:(p)ppGpp synthase/HD superfamily hydrolase